MKILDVINLFAALLIAPIAMADVNAPRDLSARVELHSFQSLIISDQQFLTGDHGGKPIMLSAELSLPQGTGRFPVVVLMHASQGIGGNIETWKRHFNGMGIATLVLDSMTGRGLTGVGSDQALIGRLNFVLDIYRSLEILKKHARIDQDRIALMGFSRGGQAVLYAGMERFEKMWNESNVQFAAYIPFYPDCATTYRSDTKRVDRPIRIFHGSSDNYNPVASCKAFVARLKDAKVNVELTEYPDTYHVFDNPLAANPAQPAMKEQSTRDCTIVEGENGELVNQGTLRVFSYKDECVRLDPLIGYNPGAAKAATVAVSSFLQSVFMK